MRARAFGRGRRAWPVNPVATAVVAALVAPACALGGPLASSLDHLAARQDPVGGGYAVAAGTETGYTSWAVLAVASAGEDAGAWRRGRASLREALLAAPGPLGVGEVTRTVVAAVAAGLDPRAAGGRDLVGRVLRAQRADGRIGSDVSTTAWGVMALVAAGVDPGAPPVARARRAIERAQRADGGWSAPDDVPLSSPITTADAVQALVAAGRHPVVALPLRRARSYLLSVQNPDGGFAPVVGGESTSLTTAWVTLAVRALGERPSRPPWDRSGGPLALLAGRQGPDGGVRNSRGSQEPSVWATSQAALAFAGKPLPLRPGPRAAPPRRAPRVVARRPLGGGRLKGPLVVRLADDEGGTGVDPRSVRLVVGGRDLTRVARLRGSRLTLAHEAIPRGPARIRLALADRAGNVAIARWRVVAPGR